jgi:probable HAF family extracellular repeat protein
MKLRLTLLLAIGTIAVTVPALAQTYTIQALKPPFGTSDPIATGFNDAGQACGFGETQNGAVATFTSGGQTVILEPTKPNDIASAKGIDNSGDVVGFELPNKAPVNIERALIWSNGGKAQDITDTSIFPGGEEPLVVNKVSGEVVGIGFTSAPINNETHMFAYANGQTVDLGPTTANATPIAINDSDVVLVNFANGDQAIFSNGTFTPIAQPPNAKATANDINNSGVVVGYIFDNGTNVIHGGLYSNGVWTDLGTLAGAAGGTRAVGINSSGQIIGLAEGKLIPKPVAHIPEMSCILQNGTWMELNSLIPANSGFNLNLSSVPVSINDAGQILLDIRTATSGNFENALLTPTQ